MFLPEIKRHPFRFILLSLILLAGGVLFLTFSFEPHSQRRVVYATAASYFIWSLYHHYRRGDLHPSLVVEYLVMALFGLILLSSTLF